MKTLLTLLFLLSPTALAGDIETVGDPAFDKLFAQIDSLDGVLDAAEGRLGRLKRDVAGSLEMSADTPLALSVYTIKQRAGGDVRVMNVEGRPIVALGIKAPIAAKDAASLLNEGTQEVSTMARDLSRLPSHIEDLMTKARALDGADATVSRNLDAAGSVKTRAQDVAEQARVLLEDVRKGVDATTAPSAPVPASPTARPAPKSVQSIPDVLSKAWLALKQDDLEAAQSLLDKADLLLPRQTQPVSRGDLTELFQMRAHVNLMAGDATAAAWAATQALVVHPTGEPLSKLGADYGKLHRALAKANIVHKVEVLTSGDGRAYLSGVELGRGSTILLGQGQHLLQVEQDGGWQSSVVYAREGFVVEL